MATNADKIKIETAWQQKARELADHAIHNLSNRDDAMGAYGSNGAYCHKITDDIPEARQNEILRRLTEHFRGKTIGGLYPQSAPDADGLWYARFGCIDLDLKQDHPRKEFRQKRNHNYAMHIMRKLELVGIACVVEDSNGRGAYHIWFRLSESIPVARLYAFLQSLVADAEEHGFESSFQRVDEDDQPLFLPDGKPNCGSDLPETFPKQSQPTGQGLGNFIRPPGRHPTYDHSSRCWGDGEWLDDEQSVDAWLNLPAADASLIPEIETEEPDQPEPARTSRQVTAKPDETLVDLAERTVDTEQWSDLLQQAGWKLHSESGDESTWTRPGKSVGVSATLNFKGSNLLHVFSSAASGLEQGQNYGKWRFYLWTNGFENRQVDAAKAYLPVAVVAEHDGKSREAFNAVKQAKNSPSVGSCPLKHGAKAPTADKSRRVKKICDEFKPFPVDVLPPVLARFCRDVARAVGCDESFPAMVALAVCSAAIGTSRQLCVKYGWFVPPLLWTLLVGESGCQKSPPFRIAMAPLRARQERDADLYKKLKARYQSDMRAYKLEYDRWKKKCEGDEPVMPESPVRTRCVVQDSTIEALAPILNENPRGVLLARDELSGWLAGFDKYSKKSGASSEVPKWLEIYNCESIQIDRKTGDERYLYVKRPFVSICGGIQPGILSRCLTEEHKDNGLQSRLLMTYPPRQAKEWRDDELTSAIHLAYSDCIRDLNEFQGDHESLPATLKLSPEAKSLYKDYINRTGQEQAAMHGHLASQWSKLEEIPARLAIILHCVRQVTTGVPDYWEVDAETMQAAINLGEWFKNETLRINRLLTIPESEREAQHLVTWIQSQGGRITARDLCKLRRDIPDSEQAEAKLIELVELGYGYWEDLRTSREFILFPQNLSAVGV